VISRQAQRAQRAATHYYCVYTFKRQPGGNYELKAIAQALNYVRIGMQERKVAAQWHRISSRVLQDLHHRTTVRTAPEEMNLAANIHPRDVTAAEFIRTYMAKIFPGGRLARREEHERDIYGDYSGKPTHGASKVFEYHTRQGYLHTLL
jgi:hypothetical protein